MRALRNDNRRKRWNRQRESKTLKEAVFVSLHVNACEKGMNPSVLSSAMGK